MKFAASVALGLVATAQAHYTFPRFVQSNGAVSPDWTAIRTTENKYSHGPVQDVNSQAMTCYEESPGRGAPQTVSVTAGGTFTFDVDTTIGHPGPLQFYLAKVPGGQTAATFNGKGAVWFKIYQDGPTGLGTSNLKWPSDGKKTVSVTIPRCVQNGEYLLRVEHIALHSASSVGGVQIYISCAQINVTGGTGTINTNGALVSFPGAYKPTDPGILFQLYWPIPTQYINPGPKVVTC